LNTSSGRAPHGAEQEVSRVGPDAGLLALHPVAHDGLEHRKQGQLEPAVRLEPHDGAPIPRVEQPLGQVGRAGKVRGIAQLGRPLVERVAIAAQPLGEQGLDQVLDRVVRAAQAGQVLDVEDEAPREPGIRVAAHGAREDPERRGQVEPAVARAHPVDQRRREHLLRERLDRQRIVRRLDDPEARHDGADQLVVHQRLASRHETGDAGFDQAGLEYLADAVGTVQHPVLAPVVARRRPVTQQVGHHPHGLAGFIGERVGVHAIIRVTGRLEPLLEQAGIAGDQPPRRVEDLSGAAAVEIEDDGRGNAEVVAEPAQDGRIGAGPREDRLLVVAHREAVPVPGGQLGDHFVLRQAQVLEFIHQHVVPPVAHAGAHVLAGPEQLARAGDEVVVVQQVAGAQGVGVGVEQLLVAGRERDVLQAMPAEQQQQLTVALRPDPKPSQYPALVVLVGDAEPAPQAGGRRVIAQQAEAEGVQCAPGDVLGQWADLALQPGGDLVGCLVGEGDGADAPGIEAMPGDEPSDAGNEAVGLAGTGPGDHEHRTERGVDRLALRGRGLEGQSELRRGAVRSVDGHGTSPASVACHCSAVSAGARQLAPVQAYPRGARPAATMPVMAGGRAREVASPGARRRTTRRGTKVARASSCIRSAVGSPRSPTMTRCVAGDRCQSAASRYAAA
jgi:hypothetical protein